MWLKKWYFNKQRYRDGVSDDRLRSYCDQGFDRVKWRRYDKIKWKNEIVLLRSLSVVSWLNYILNVTATIKAVGNRKHPNDLIYFQMMTFDKQTFVIQSFNTISIVRIEKSILSVYITRSLGKQHDVCEERRMNPKLGTIYQPLRSGRIWHKVDF